MKNRATLPLITAFFFGIAGLLLWQFPADPDAAFSTARTAGVLCLFIFFSACIWSWGRFCISTLGLKSLDPLGSLVLGVMWASWTMTLLGQLGAIGFSKDVYALVLLGLGPLLALAQSKSPTSSSPCRRYEATDRAAICLAVIAMLARISIASLAHGSSDPVLYHLLAPRVWWDEGHIAVPSAMPISFQSTYWEYLIIWGNALFAAPPNRGLIEVQQFGQYLHVLFGFGGCVLALALLARRLGISRPGAVCCALIAVNSTNLWNLSWVANNDFGAIFLALSSIVFLMTETPVSRIRRWVIAGAVAGFSIATKYNMALTVIPVFAGAAILETKAKAQLNTESLARRLQPAALGIAAALLASCPIWIRNWTLAGNPVFPFLDSVFHSPILSSMEKANASLWTVQSNARGFGDELWIALQDNIASLLVILLAFSPLRKKPALALSALLLCGSAVAYALFCSLRIDPSVLRWIGAALFLVPLLGAISLMSMLENLFQATLRKQVSLLCCVGILGYQLYNERDSLATVALGAPPNLILRDNQVHMGGAAKAWLRMNAQPSDLVVTTGENQLYYLTGVEVRVIGEDLAWDEPLSHIHDPDALLRFLRSQGARYALDTEHWSKPFWTEKAYLLNVLVAKHPDVVVFQSPGSKVIDLKLLEKDVGVTAAKPREKSVPQSQT